MTAKLLSMSQAKAAASARLFEPTPDDLRTLVLDYLCHSSYSSTARAFQTDSAVKHLDADGDELMLPSDKGDALAAALKERLAMGELRKEIRICVLSGQVDKAIELLNIHFASVLSETSEPIPPKSTDELQYIPSTSVNPAHLALNLHILAFIEASRTIPLPYCPPGTEPPPPSDAAQDMDVGRQETPETANDHLLHRAQNLYAEANSLADANDRGIYLRELYQVGGLLAYTMPERGPMAIYMTQDRREAVADQVESAILYRTEQPVVSKLDLTVRQTSVVWSMLHQLKAKLPPLSSWPSGVVLSTGSQTSQMPENPSGGADTNPVPAKKVDNDSTEIASPFDLHAFLDITP